MEKIEPTTWQVYSWGGVPIYDIKVWAQERGEKMVQYRETTHTVYGPEVIYGEMSESFWNSLMWNGRTHYEELGRT